MVTLCAEPDEAPRRKPWAWRHELVHPDGHGDPDRTIDLAPSLFIADETE